MVLYNFRIYFVSAQCWFAFQDSGTEMGLCHILHCALAMKDPYVTVRTVWRFSRPFLSHGLLFRSDIKPVGSWERNVPKAGNAFLAGFWLFFDRLSRPWPLRWKGHKGHFKSLQHSSITSDSSDQTCWMQLKSWTWQMICIYSDNLRHNPSISFDLCLECSWTLQSQQLLCIGLLPLARASCSLTFTPAQKRASLSLEIGLLVAKRTDAASKTLMVLDIIMIWWSVYCIWYHDTVCLCIYIYIL